MPGQTIFKPGKPGVDAFQPVVEIFERAAERVLDSVYEIAERPNDEFVDSVGQRVPRIYEVVMYDAAEPRDALAHSLNTSLDTRVFQEFVGGLARLLETIGDNAPRSSERISHIIHNARAHQLDDVSNSPKYASNEFRRSSKLIANRRKPFPGFGNGATNSFGGIPYGLSHVREPVSEPLTGVPHGLRYRSPILPDEYRCGHDGHYCQYDRTNRAQRNDES